jgi:hypothetical protein
MNARRAVTKTDPRSLQRDRSSQPVPPPHSSMPGITPTWGRYTVAQSRSIVSRNENPQRCRVFERCYQTISLQMTSLFDFPQRIETQYENCTLTREALLVNYGATPYAISFNPAYSRGAEQRPISDVDGNGSAAKTVVHEALTALEGDDLVADQEDDSKSLRVCRVQEFDKFTFVEFGVARAGIEGNLHPEAADRVPINAKDQSETYVRSVFIAPDGGHELYWLNERAGQTTAYGSFERRLRAALRDAFPEFTYKISPVADWAAVRSWAESVPVKDMTFVAPRRGGTTQAMDVNGIRARVEVKVKPKTPLSLRSLLNDTGPDRNKVFGFLAGSVFSDHNGVSSQSVVSQGWSARVTFDTPSGRQRSFGLDVVDKDPTLVYQVGPRSEVGAASRPSDTEFLKACADFVLDASALIPSAESIKTDLVISTPAPRPQVRTS